MAATKNGLTVPDATAQAQSHAQSQGKSQAQAEPQALIGFGRVWHRRLRPVLHQFSYASYFFMLPLRALRGNGCAGLTRNRFGALSFFDADHGDGRDDALAWFDAMLQDQGVPDAQGEVWLQTYPRVLGYAFKPVSFWYAHRVDGTLAAVVAEVNNTFGQRHCYLLTGTSLAWRAQMQADKVFHVSPFCAVQGDYRFRFDMSGGAPHAAGRVLARVDHHDDGGPLLQTSLGGRLRLLNRANTRRAFWGMPLMTLAVVLRIHWQALRLAIKRVSFHSLPKPPDHFVSR